VHRHDGGAVIEARSAAAECNTVAIANCRGEIPGMPRIPNASMNASSRNTSPNSSRTRIANDPCRNAALATVTVCSGTSGSARGRIDIEEPHPDNQMIAGHQPERTLPGPNDHRHAAHRRVQN
jgi:hypothetical protein